MDQLTVDTNGDGKPDAADGVIDDNDKVMLGKGFPDFTYGITLNASYKGFDLTVFGTGAEGNSIFNCLTRIDRPRANRLKIFITIDGIPRIQMLLNRDQIVIMKINIGSVAI